MILYIIRHAWAGQSGDPAWPDDAQRPLTDEGRKRFAKMARKLAKRKFAPQLIATSPLVRCRQTAELVVKAVKPKPRLVERAELQPGSDLAGLLAWTAEEAARLDEVAWVGHAPDVDRLTAMLIGEGGCQIGFAKGAVAAIEFPDLPRAGDGELIWLVTAKTLGVA